MTLRPLLSPFWVLAPALALAGCGADVAATAVTTSKMQATQAEQLKRDLEAAMQRQAEAASAAAGQ